jgi:flagella basal body P-ring formation protein FlgA
MVFFGISVVCVGQALAQTPPIVFELKPFAQLSARQVRLGEIATQVPSANPDIRTNGDLLENMVVATVSHVNQALRIDANQLMQIVLRRQPALRGQLEIRGASEVSVILLGVPISEAQIRTSVEQFLQDQLPKYLYNVELTALSTPSIKAPIPAGDLTLSPRLNSEFRPSAQLTLTVNVMVNHAVVERIPVVAQIRAQMLVYQLKRQVSIREPLDADSYEIVQASLPGSAQNALAAQPSKQLMGMRARRDLGAASIIEGADIEPIPDVSRMQRVSATLKQGLVQIEKIVVAQSDGQVGQRIKVFDERTASTYFAKVVGAGLVKIE